MGRGSIRPIQTAGGDMKTKCTVENGYGKCTIEAKEDLELYDLVNGLVVATILGMGYSPKAVAEHIGDKLE